MIDPVVVDLACTAEGAPGFAQEQLAAILGGLGCQTICTVCPVPVDVTSPLVCKRCAGSRVVDGWSTRWETTTIGAAQVVEALTTCTDTVPVAATVWQANQKVTIVMPGTKPWTGRCDQRGRAFMSIDDYRDGRSIDVALGFQEHDWLDRWSRAFTIDAAEGTDGLTLVTAPISMPGRDDAWQIGRTDLGDWVTWRVPYTATLDLSDPDQWVLIVGPASGDDAPVEWTAVHLTFGTELWLDL